jgi:hypothetical protein
VFCLSARNSEKRIGKRVGYVQQTLAWLGTPDCPVRQASPREIGLSGAPVSPEEQRSDMPNLEGDRAPDHL